MNQLKLDSWLDIKEPKYSISRYFYLEWTNMFKPNKQPVWLDSKPECNFIKEIKWPKVKNGFSFYICANIDDETTFLRIKRETKYKNISYLKSHLQKSVRRGDTDIALRTALHLIKLNPSEFLRRLPIIMIEDVSLHESISTIVWLMVAITQKGFKLTTYMVEWLLGVVWVLCNIKKKDVIKITIDSENHKMAKILDDFKDFNLEYKSCLYSLQLRKCYGGMKGDIKMINKYTKIWKRRFQESNVPKYFTKDIKPVSIILDDLDLCNWNISGIDFHCAPQIFELIRKKYPEYSDDELKKIIWHNSSKLNFRVKQSEYKKEEWNKIKYQVTRAQKYLLEKYY